MRCSNCGAELQSRDRFCTFCGTPQPSSSTTSLVDVGTTPVPPAADITLPMRGDILVMSPDERIWDFVENVDALLRPGQRRPVLIVDEESVHLAHTDRRLEPQELLDRVGRILQAQNVPVDAQLVRAQWLGDAREARPRLIASLRNHTYSDVKMIMGLDYMGSWASFQLQVGTEPEPLPRFEVPAWILAVGGVGVLLVLFGSAEQSLQGMASLGFLGIVVSVVALFLSWRGWQAAQVQRSVKKAIERLSRTFKIDDMRLFCTAMRQVFQAVVDDIVDRGGKVIRIEGGKGGFFQAVGSPIPEPSTRAADASRVEA